jgi:hypothetical protein
MRPCVCGLWRTSLAEPTTGQGRRRFTGGHRSTHWMCSARLGHSDRTRARAARPSQKRVMMRPISHNVSTVLVSVPASPSERLREEVLKTLQPLSLSAPPPEFPLSALRRPCSCRLK